MKSTDRKGTPSVETFERSDNCRFMCSTAACYKVSAGPFENFIGPSLVVLQTSIRRHTRNVHTTGEIIRILLRYRSGLASLRRGDHGGFVLHF